MTKKLEDLRNDPGIVRNKLKIKATVSNAKAFLKIQEELVVSTHISGSSWMENQFKMNGKT